jgi:hypothetical protein
MSYRVVYSPDDIPYCVLAERSSKTRVYRLLRLSLARPSKLIIKEFTNRVLAEEKTIGSIEWWEKGGMIHKPMEPFDIISITKI